MKDLSSSDTFQLPVYSSTYIFNQACPGKIKMKTITKKKNNIFRKIKYAILRISRSRGSVNEIAFGASIGAFFAVFPTFGVGILMVIFLSRIFRFNLVAAVSSSIISNPLTSPFFMLLSFKIGSLILSSEIDFNIKEWKHQLGEAGLTILIGALIVSSTVSLIVYFAVKFFVEKYRIRKDKQTTSG